MAAADRVDFTLGPPLPLAGPPPPTLAVFHLFYKLALRMSSGAIVHAAVFAVGALIGGGVATAVSRKREATTIYPPVPPQGVPAQTPVLDVRGSNSDGVIMRPPAWYGHGGRPCGHEVRTSWYVELPLFASVYLCAFAFCTGPVSDLLVRRAYIAAYDRRLRHPAWVRPWFSTSRDPVAPAHWNVDLD